MQESYTFYKPHNFNILFAKLLIDIIISSNQLKDDQALMIFQLASGKTGPRLVTSG